MAAKGTIAKETITNKILEAFGEDAFIYDKKLYVWVDENGERTQVAVTLTCPKVPVGTVVVVDRSKAPNFSDKLEFGVQEAQEVAQTQITTDERENIRLLMKNLGL